MALTSVPSVILGHHFITCQISWHASATRDLLGTLLYFLGFPSASCEGFLSLPLQQSKSAIQLTEHCISTLPLLYDGMGPGAPAWSSRCVCVLSGICGYRERGTCEHPCMKHLPLFYSSSRTSTEFFSALPHIPLHSACL